MPDLSNIAQLGMGGLALLLMYRLVANHSAHMTQALNDLRAAIVALMERLEK